MYCTKCGKENPDEKNFCRFCGAPLRKANSASEDPGRQGTPVSRGPSGPTPEDADALFEMGERYWDGRNGVARNPEKAVEYYVRAGQLGHVNAIYSLGYCYAKGVGVNRDVQKAQMLLAYAIDHGSII